VQHVEQLGCVFGEPMIGLDVAKLRGRPAVADDWALSVLLTVAEAAKALGPVLPASTS
jgi:hypothetical protein